MFLVPNRDYKHFDNNEVREELIKELFSNNVQSDDLAQFTNISKIILEKKRQLWKKGVPDITKVNLWKKKLQKAVISRSRLLNRYRKKKKKQLDLHIKDN